MITITFVKLSLILLRYNKNQVVMAIFNIPRTWFAIHSPHGILFSSYKSKLSIFYEYDDLFDVKINRVKK